MGVKEGSPLFLEIPTFVPTILACYLHTYISLTLITENKLLKISIEIMAQNCDQQ